MYMPVFRTEKVSDYAVIAKHHLKNKALSYKAKGLLTFMLSVPPEWDWSMAGLSTLASDGIDGVRSGIRELEKHGYLSRRRIREASGKLGDIEYTIHEIPQSPQSSDPNQLPGGPMSSLSSNPTPTSDSPTLEEPMLAKPILENPTLVKPTQDLPTQENPMERSNNQSSIDGLSINGLNNKTNQCADALHVRPGNNGQLSLEDTTIPNQDAERLWVQTAQGTDKPVNPAMTLLEPQFEQFWQLYPRKAGKKAAKKAWMGIKPDELLFDTIITAISAANQYWRQQGTQQKHIPHPSTWLNEERWDDEYPVSQPPNMPVLAINYSRTGGERNASIGTDYTIGGDNDPYREIM